MKNKFLIYIILVLAVIITLSNTIFILNETEQAIVTQFGKPVGDPRGTPGINFKVPFVQVVQRFDKRFLAWDGDPNQIPTKDKKYIFVDSYARWQITNPLQFFIRLTDERQAQSRLDDILDGETRNAIASFDLLEIVRSSNREPEVSEDFLEELEVLEEIKIGRSRIEKQILAKANERTSDLGIRILDFRLKRLNYVEEVQNNVYDRMISERNRIADQFRSEGQGEARIIQGNKERDLAKIQSEAFKEAEQIRGRADAQATDIYAKAYNKSQAAKDLYAFLRAMETLEKSFDKQTNLILTTDSELYKYLKAVK
jgi:membrane protease subunit HflC